MIYLIMFLVCLGLIGVDQITKFLTISNIPLHEQIEVLPGLFNLTYAQNTGAAFSMMEGQKWFFLAIVILLCLGIIWEFRTKFFPFTTFERWCIVFVAAGGLSNNVIDRLCLGYVVDMIQLDFINFPIFNLADCFVVCGCILLTISLFFFNKDFWQNKESLSENDDK